MVTHPLIYLLHVLLCFFLFQQSKLRENKKNPPAGPMSRHPKPSYSPDIGSAVFFRFLKVLAPFRKLAKT